MSEVLLEARNLSKEFPLRGRFGRPGGTVRAVDDVTLQVRAGETLGLVGESGSGKTTLGRCLLQMEQPTAGDILYRGTSLASLSREEHRASLRQMQVIFQDPFSALNPRRTALEHVLEPLQLLTSITDPEARAREVLDHVGISGTEQEKYPRAFSGGQRQRIGIARAIAVRPEFIVCDEPVSALDLSIQAQILRLLASLQEEFHLTYLFISHDLGVVRHIADRVAVMHRGRIVELADTQALFDDPRHPYTQRLLAAAPVMDPALAKEQREARRQSLALPNRERYGPLDEVAPGHFVSRIEEG
ncbi:MAG: ATP-binding cassette domain-containing protein [Propionibacteriaceae bacterium]|nr:ATP-binding cassette domain-containing protein [Propionibacteriaceae bacterium]